jgi:tRNA-splicing ligase RtcB (3'-phosphate/5'-hydroxy nucleic acid ligase)
MNYSSFGGPFETTVYRQMELAMSIPPAVQGALMPDAHPGYALPIGGVIALKNAISPAFVGYDIACRMHATFYQIQEADTEQEALKQVLDLIKSITNFGVGSTAHHDHPIMDDPRWEQNETLRTLRDKADSQLGSSGGGNHFAAFMTTTTDEGELWGAFVTHSGSRGTGYQLADHYAKAAADYITKKGLQGIPKGYEWLDMDTEEGQEYFTAMRLMGDYAKANHLLIHNAFQEKYHHPVVKVISNHHNYAWQYPDNLYIHRKGATPADKDVLGIIPSSMATPAFVVRGKGNLNSLYSAAHGAGRVSSRSQAKKRFDRTAYQRRIKQAGILTHGIDTDESYQAYKDIDEVMKAQTECVDIVMTLHPRVEVMGGKNKEN